MSQRPGTTGSGEALMPFKLGAFIPGGPVQRMALRLIDVLFILIFAAVIARFWYSHFNPADCDPKLWFLRLMTQFVQHIEIEYLPVYYPSAEEKLNPALFAENVRTLMATALGIPKTEVGVDDYVIVKEVSFASSLAFSHASKCRLPNGIGPVELCKMRLKHGISIAEWKGLFSLFWQAAAKVCACESKPSVPPIEFLFLLCTRATVMMLQIGNFQLARLMLFRTVRRSISKASRGHCTSTRTIPTYALSLCSLPHVRTPPSRSNCTSRVLENALDFTAFVALMQQVKLELAQKDIAKQATTLLVPSKGQSLEDVVRALIKARALYGFELS